MTTKVIGTFIVSLVNIDCIPLIDNNENGESELRDHLGGEGGVESGMR